MIEHSIDLSRSANLLASERKTKTVICPVCGIEKTGIGRIKYCSHKCANIASYRRVKERVTTKPNEQSDIEQLSNLSPTLEQRQLTFGEQIEQLVETLQSTSTERKRVQRLILAVARTIVNEELQGQQN